MATNQAEYLCKCVLAIYISLFEIALLMILYLF
jgi:hypothetical protein